MNRMEKLRRIRLKREQYCRFCAMKDWHFGNCAFTTPVQLMRKQALLKKSGCTR